MIQEELDKRANTGDEYAQKLNTISSLAGLASECQAYAEYYYLQDTKDPYLKLMKIYAERINASLSNTSKSLITLISREKAEYINSKNQGT